MQAPDWYDTWCEEAFESFSAKQQRMEAAYMLGAWARYDYDAVNCTLTFSDDAGPRVVADMQVIGTIGPNDWLWGWSNDVLPSASVADLQRVREFGAENGIEELTTNVIVGDDLTGVGWMFAAIATRVLGAEGAYRAPTADGAVYLLIRSIKFVS